MPNSQTDLDLLLTTLSCYQTKLLSVFRQFGSDCYDLQYHADLSPIGWHLGHCVYTELYWIREAWLDIEQCPQEYKNLYIPELSNKSQRGGKLPEFDTLTDWALQTQKDSLQLLKQHSRKQHPLSDNDFLIRFLLQHYAQHIETASMILQMKSLTEVEPYSLTNPVKTKPVNVNAVTIEPGDYEIGVDKKHFYYDNETPVFKYNCDGFNISTLPVTNGEYLSFMEDRGYQHQRFWTEQGSKWLDNVSIKHPVHWQKNKNGNWFQQTPEGPKPLLVDDPVYGISWHEATAFANWAGARLPHEYEWEIAKKRCALDKTGIVWEWCQNTFHPYSGFAAFPYEGYSCPYFDGQHYVLKGGSQYSCDEIKRPSFRNYYQPDKRHIFAGLRLVVGE